MTTKLEVMTLFSNFGQSERKKSFMITSCRLRWRCIPHKPASAKLNLKHPEFLPLFELFGAGLLGRSGHHRLGLIRAGPGIHVTRLYIDECIFAKLSEVIPQLGLQVMHVNRLLDTRFDIVESRYARHYVVNDLKNYKTLLRPNHVRHVALLQIKNGIFELFG